jgi:plasmid stabilization system protein ParE
MTYRLSLQAALDLEGIADHIAQDSPTMPGGSSSG